MDLTDRILFIGLLCTLLVFLGGAFAYNLPHWCAHPERPGNSYVQPLCPAK